MRPPFVTRKTQKAPETGHFPGVRQKYGSGVRAAVRLLVMARILVATARPYDVTLALRDAGHEAIYVGEQDSSALLAVAQQEDVAAIVTQTPMPELARAGYRVVLAAPGDLSDVLAQLP